MKWSCSSLVHSLAGSATPTASGTQIHSLALRSGLLSHPRLANSLLSFYAKSHSPAAARRFFDDIPLPDVYARTTLLSAYSKSGLFPHALQLFDQMPHRDTPVWNAIITGSVLHGHHSLALHMFANMRLLGVPPDRYTLASITSILPSAAEGRQLHSVAVRTGLIPEKVSVVNAMVTMYFDCGSVADAYGLFIEAAEIRDGITYNAVIAGLANWGREEEALMVFKEMKGEACLRATELTFVNAFSACSSKETTGRQVHAQAIKTGLGASVLVGNAALSMYADCGDLISARRVFENIDNRDIVSWNSMISGYSQEKCCESATGVYRRMLMAGIEPDEFTYGSLITCLDFREHCEMIHALVVRNGLVSHIEVCNAMISTYAKCGEMDCAYRVFGGMGFRNLISWNSIISGCSLNGLPVKGLESFSDMMESGLKPNSYTLSTLLSICAGVSALRHGKETHGFVIRSGCDCETSLGNALITMYAKCGDMDCCSKVFNRTPRRDVVTWNAIIAAHAQNGDGHGAIHHFNKLQDLDEIPDEVTFTIALSACSHAGLVEKSRIIFSSMVEDYGIEPGVDHYSCVIDLLGRAGHLDEVERLISGMPFRVDSHIWWVLLSACRTHGNLRLGRIAARSLLETEPDNPAIYIMLSNINAAEGQWKEASSVREQMRENGVVKLPGYSWMIESESSSSAFTL